MLVVITSDGGMVMEILLHHVAVITRDLDRSAHFYEHVLQFQRIVRPPFSIDGRWLSAGPSLQIHLTVYPQGNFRSGPVDNDDVHFALRTDDFEAAVSRLVAAGYNPDAAPDDPMRMILKRTGPAGFPQLYVMDPDRNIMEINGAS